MTISNITVPISPLEGIGPPVVLAPVMVAAGDRLANVITTTTAAILTVPWMLISLCLDRPMPPYCRRYQPSAGPDIGRIAQVSKERAQQTLVPNLGSRYNPS